MSTPDALASIRSTFWNPSRVSMQNCSVCTAPTDGYAVCFNCLNHSRSGLRVADLVAPITYGVKSEQSYTDLTIYKSGSVPTGAKEAAAGRLIGMVHASLSLHLGCIATAGGQDIVVTTVPSTSGVRSSVHPLTEVLTMFGKGFVKTSLTYTGVPGLDRNARRALAADTFIVDGPADVVGKHVLIIDDSWVQGGHLQSCAVALHAAGARWVTALPIGRVLDPSFSTTKSFMESHRVRVFDPDICPITGAIH
jgi:hypothetical protein